MSLQPHQQRVADEADQLDERITKLTAFLASPAVEALPDAERTLMGSQLHAMRSYSFFLRARLQRWQVA